MVYYHRLKKQIQNYQKIYKQEYGELPKKNSDFTPIKDIIRQYESLKRTLQNNAAVQIQALWRRHIVCKKYKLKRKSIVNNNKKLIFTYGNEDVDVPFYTDDELNRMEITELKRIKEIVKEEVMKYDSLFNLYYQKIVYLLLF